eukprot:TRINITY_DN10145_c0_g1_i1.p1 TRINITY_DN10145_c0_g1~~TRINITY_DN10145_c0_g1_i1.p1  ORF type:complete len:465 (-),score=100.30 TRINITY_DN10145_c0_g1_i1:73-1329(-)
MAIDESLPLYGEMMATQEINVAGGVLKKMIKPMLVDGASDWAVFEKQANVLAKNKDVKAVFGCYTVASLKAAAPAFEKENKLLVYPVDYEGNQCNKNIFYTGSVPNQQVELAVDWMSKNKNKNVFLVGSDCSYPKTVFEQIRSQLTIVRGIEYVPLGDRSNSTFDPIIRKIKSALKDGGVIVNALSGDSWFRFLEMFYDAGFRADDHPNLFLLQSEADMWIDAKYVGGHYISSSFFQSIGDLKSRPGFNATFAKEFVQSYQEWSKKQGKSNSIASEPVASAYTAVKLWAKAVEAAGTFEVDKVREAAKGVTVLAPEGVVTMLENNHISKFYRLAQIDAKKNLKIIDESTKAVLAKPFSDYSGDKSQCQPTIATTTTTTTTTTKKATSTETSASKASGFARLALLASVAMFVSLTAQSV